MIYNHLIKKGIPQYRTGPAVLSANIAVPLRANQQRYKVEENSPVERSHPVGLWVTLAGTKVDEIYTQATGAPFDSAYLVLKNRQREIYEKISFEQVRNANLQGRPYYINLPGPLNLSESEVHVPDNATIPVDTVIEFQIDYLDPEPVTTAY